jgi:hypothetical protein
MSLNTHVIIHALRPSGVANEPASPDGAVAGWLLRLAGLFSSILMALLMIAHYMNLETGELKSR